MMVCSDPGIGVTGMVNENSWRLSVDIVVAINLNRHAFPRATAFGFGKIDERTFKDEDKIVSRNVAIGEYSQPHLASVDANLLSRIILV